MKPGIDSYCYHEALGRAQEGKGGMSIETFLQRARACGARGVSLETVFMPSLDRQFLHALRAQLDALALDRVLAWGHPQGLRGGRDQEALKDLCAHIESAQIIGATTMRIVGGSFQTYPEPHEPQIQALTAMLTTAVQVARKYNIVMAYENHLDFRIDEVLRIVEAVDSPFLRVTFDSGNAFRVGDDPVEAARKIAPYVAATHIKDVVRGPQDAGRIVARWPSVPLGRGLVNIREVVRNLQGAGYQGLLCVEIDVLSSEWTSRDEAVVESVRYLEEILEEIGG